MRERTIQSEKLQYIVSYHLDPSLSIQ
jgi:hypothetical protein